MAFEQFKQDLTDIEIDLRSYVVHSNEYVRLKVFKISMRYLISVMQFLLLGAVFLFALLFLSFAASLALSETLDSYYGGFLIVGGCYAVVGVLLYIFRERLNAPVLKKYAKYYFE